MNVMRTNLGDFRLRKCSPVTGSWVFLLSALLLLVVPYVSSRPSDEVVDDIHSIEKRDANFAQNDANRFLNYGQRVNSAQHPSFRHPVRGNYRNPEALRRPRPARFQTPNNQPLNSFNIGTRFGGEDETDRVVWPSRVQGNRKPVPTRRVPPPLFRDPNPANKDVSFMTRGDFGQQPLFRDPNPDDVSFMTRGDFGQPPLDRDPNSANDNVSFMTRADFVPTRRVPPPLIRDLNPQTTGAPLTTTKPAPTRRVPPPLIRDINRESTEAPIITSESPQTASPTKGSDSSKSPETTSSPATERTVSNCTWAIVQCCSPDNLEIRYNCFESMGCHGAFWDKNPCSAEIQESAMNYVNGYLN